MDGLLKPHQVEAIDKINHAFHVLNGKSFLLGDEVGLMKTRVACSIANDIWQESTSIAYNKILIVVPLSTFSGWKYEAEAVGLPLKPVAKATGWPGIWPTLINYDRLDRVPEVGSWYNKNLFEANEFDLIIFDEAHKLKGVKTKRKKIWKALNAKAKKVLYLTATPGQSPMDCCYLGDIAGFSSYWSWVRSFEGVFVNKWGGIDFKPGYRVDRERLSKITVDNPFSIRRTPKDIVGWPELERIVFPIELTPQQGKQYEDAMEDYIREREENMRGALHPMAYDMVAAGQFRKRLSELKVNATSELAETLMEQNKVVVISCEYLNSARSILENLSADWKCGFICGDTSSEARQEILAASKADDLDCIIFTVEEGINLQQWGDSHRQRVQIDHDIRWSGLEQHQLDGRCHRAGRSALVYLMSVAGTIDERVARVMKKRLSTIGMINGEELDLNFRVNPDEYLFGEPEKDSIEKI